MALCTLGTTTPTASELYQQVRVFGNVIATLFESKGDLLQALYIRLPAERWVTLMDMEPIFKF